jgi:putative ABC transport system ATP-binding protein
MATATSFQLTDSGLDPDTNPVAVRVRGVAKAFGAGEQKVHALKGVSCEFQKGKMSMIIGPSGCGKTTLLSVIAGILNPDEGAVDIFGSDVTAMRDGERTRFRARRIGFVFQQYNLLPALTAAENAAIPLVIAGLKKSEAVDRARSVLQSLGMGNKTESLPNQLSGGQQQRVAISRALVHEPSLLVCDEPTAALDHETGHTVMELLREAAVRVDRAVVVVTHDNRIFHFGDRIVRMDDGLVAEMRDQVPGLAPIQSGF